jgi:hypothetical protein
MKTAVVITIGSKCESLGAMKLARWLRRTGWSVIETNRLNPMHHCRADLFAFSCVFSWKLPELADQAIIAKTLGGEIWIGGPAVTFDKRNAAYVRRETGINPHIGIDERFEREPGHYAMVYFSRGCPAYTKACGNCPVPRIEGSEFTYYPDAAPAPLLCDNNLSALPDDYQQHIIDRYARDWRGGLVDANSGFEPHSFTAATLARWSKFPLAFWRFGYDDMSEREQAIEMMRVLKAHGYSGRRVRVYTMIGNEPMSACYQRVREVIDHGMYPWPQRLRPLGWLGGDLPCSHGWDEPTLIAFQRFFSIAKLWRTIRPEEFYYQSRRPLAALAA